jgi:hypothetical protein
MAADAEHMRSTFRQRPHRSFLVLKHLFPAAPKIAAQLLDGLAGNLAAGFLIEF